MKHAIFVCCLALGLGVPPLGLSAYRSVAHNDSTAMADAMWAMMVWLAAQMAANDNGDVTRGYRYAYPDPGPYLAPGRYPEVWQPSGLPPLFALNPASPWAYFGPAGPWDSPANGATTSSSPMTYPPVPTHNPTGTQAQPGQYPPTNYDTLLNHPAPPRITPAAPPSGFPSKDYMPYPSAEPPPTRDPQAPLYWSPNDPNGRPQRADDRSPRVGTPRGTHWPQTWPSSEPTRTPPDPDRGDWDFKPMDRTGFDVLPGPQHQRWGGTVDLDGIWQAPNGERWYVRGDRFWLQAGPDDYREGRFEIRDNSLFAEVPKAGVSAIYEYMQMKDTLMLRDRRGETLLFHRVRD